MYINQKGFMLACGRLAKNAEYKQVGVNQSSLCRFSIRVGDVASGDGGKTAKWLDCVCWHKLAKYASGLEKGDTVLVCGILKDASYTSKKTGEFIKKSELDCEFVTVQQDPPDMGDTGSDFIVTCDDNDDSELPF